MVARALLAGPSLSGRCCRSVPYISKLLHGITYTGSRHVLDDFSQQARAFSNRLKRLIIHRIEELFTCMERAPPVAARQSTRHLATSRNTAVWKAYVLSHSEDLAQKTRQLGSSCRPMGVRAANSLSCFSLSHCSALSSFVCPGTRIVNWLRRKPHIYSMEGTPHGTTPQLWHLLYFTLPPYRLPSEAAGSEPISSLLVASSSESSLCPADW